MEKYAIKAFKNRPIWSHCQCATFCSTHTLPHLNCRMGNRLVIHSHSLSLTLTFSVTSKKSPNVYKSCPKMISLEIILTPLQKLPKNVGDLGKLNVAKGF